ncbi:MAG TPA: EexN family lipoprotein [Phenylobacterium sp.]
MIGRTLAIGALAALAACSPAPRSASYFEAHPEETAKVVVDCASGAHQGQECVNAKAGAAAIRRDRRMDRYKQNF